MSHPAILPNNRIGGKISLAFQCNYMHTRTWITALTFNRQGSVSHLRRACDCASSYCPSPRRTVPETTSGEILLMSRKVFKISKETRC
eukprot:scaffold200803_cov47-Attheya_sp.AAC.3